MYEELNGSTYRTNNDGERQQLSNFTARIVRETRLIDDGTPVDTRLAITGEQAGKKKNETQKLPEIQITADEFMSMSWPTRRWGTRCVMLPGNGIKDDLRTHIQFASQPEITNIYKHIGWTTINGIKVYLHAGGGITKDGNDESIRIAVPPEFQAYNLSKAPEPAEALKATFALLDLLPQSIAWPLLAATFAPLFGPIDFAVHVTGRTGTFKSELVSLLASHYGETIDARHLPGSWSSTANALEAQAHVAKNAIFPIDDFVPTGTSWQVKAYQTTADKIIRAQGNQAGRARLNDTSNLQSTNYPRGLILSTGEDTPEGHSVRARMLIIELSPGDIDPVGLTRAQHNRPLYKGTTAALAQSLAKKPINLGTRAKAIRDTCLGIGHNRTPTMLGTLQATIEQLIQLAVQYKIVTPAASKGDIEAAWKAICDLGNNQSQYLEAADPCEVFITNLRQIFGQKMAHARKLNGGVPGSPEILGWTCDDREQHNMYKSHGPCIAWIDWDAGEFYLDITVGFQMVRKIAGNELTLTKGTLTKRLKESGEIIRSDDARQRSTIRITAEDHPRLVLCFNITRVLNTQEKP